MLNKHTQHRHPLQLLPGTAADDFFPSLPLSVSPTHHSLSSRNCPDCFAGSVLLLSGLRGSLCRGFFVIRQVKWIEEASIAEVVRTGSSYVVHPSFPAPRSHGVGRMVFWALSIWLFPFRTAFSGFLQIQAEVTVLSGPIETSHNWRG